MRRHCDARVRDILGKADTSALRLSRSAADMGRGLCFFFFGGGGGGGCTAKTKGKRRHTWAETHTTEALALCLGEAGAYGYPYAAASLTAWRLGGRGGLCFCCVPSSAVLGSVLGRVFVCLCLCAVGPPACPSLCVRADLPAGVCVCSPPCGVLASSLLSPRCRLLYSFSFIGRRRGSRFDYE